MQLCTVLFIWSTRYLFICNTICEVTGHTKRHELKAKNLCCVNSLLCQFAMSESGFNLKCLGNVPSGLTCKLVWTKGVLTLLKMILLIE